MNIHETMSTTEENCKFCGLIFVNAKAKINHSTIGETCQMYSNQIATLPNGESGCKMCDSTFPKEMTAYFHIKREHLQELKNQLKETVKNFETTNSEKITEKSVKRSSTRGKKPKLMLENIETNNFVRCTSFGQKLQKAQPLPILYFIYNDFKANSI